MRLKFLYTVVLIFCMSAFASSNECTRTCRENHPRLGAAKVIPEEEAEATPFQVIKFLYI
jgi:hypothetical protein